MTHTFKHTLGAMLFALVLTMGLTTIAFADEETDAEKAIEEAKDVRTDLNKLIADADAYAGIDVDQAEAAYEDGNDLILDAEAELQKNDFEEAKDLADEAKEILEDAYDELLDEVSGDAKETLELAREYMDAAEELLDDADKDDLDYDDAVDLYEDAQEDLDYAEERFDANDFQDAEDYARDVIALVEDMFRELDVEIEYYLIDEDDVEDALEEAEEWLEYAEMALDEANQSTYGYEVSSALYTKAKDRLEEAQDAYDDEDFPVAYTGASYVIDASEEILERLKRTVEDFEDRDDEDEDEEMEDESEDEDEEEYSAEEAAEREKMEQVIALLTQLIALLTQQLVR